MNDFIPYAKPSITVLEREYVNDAMKSGWGKNCYSYIDKFEENFSQYIGSKFCIATSSCTGAMTIGLHALGIGAGDEVILADTNWIATVAPIVNLGAKPIFVDIDPITWCIDAKSVISAITDKTKAVVATHLYGNICDLEQLKNLCDKYSLFLIEDAAEALGGFYNKKHVGTMGVFSVFSFHGTKTMTTGEGGALITSDENFYDEALTLSNHGRNINETKQFWPSKIGYKFKMSNIQAALGCAQLIRVNSLVKRKREILDFYKNELQEILHIKMNQSSKNSEMASWMPVAVFKKEVGISREIILANLKKSNIDGRVFFFPLSSLDLFEAVPENRFSYDIPTRAINLPSFHDISKAQMSRVCDVLRSLM